MNEFSWPNLGSPEIVCATPTEFEEADKIRHRLAKLITASRKASQYGVFVEPYGNVFRVVVRDRLASEKVKRVRREKRAAKESQGRESALRVVRPGRRTLVARSLLS